MEFDLGTDLVLFVFRVGLGLTLAAHGYSKFFMGGRLAGTGGWFDPMGMKPGRAHAVLAASSEVMVGVFMAIGLLTSVVALGFVALMFVAWYTVHRDKGFFILGEGWEYVFILALSASAIAAIGPGGVSFDALFGIDGWLRGLGGFGFAAFGGSVTGALFLAAFFRPLSPRTED